MHGDGAGHETLMTHLDEPGLAHDRSQLLGCLEPLGRRREVGVGCALPGDQPPEQRDDPPQIQAHDRPQRRGRRRRGVEADDAPPGPHDAHLLAESPRAVGDVAQQVAGGHGVETGVGKRQRQRVGGAPGDPVAARPPPSTRIISSEKSAAVIRAPLQPQRLERNVARAARQIEEPSARRERRREHHGAPPGPVAPERHQGVHELIAAGDAVEHRPHLSRRTALSGCRHRRDS